LFENDLWNYFIRGITLYEENKMANSLIVLAFDNTEEADKVLEALERGKRDGIIQIDDAAVVVKDADGKVHVKNQVSHGSWMSTGVGGMLGLLIGGIFMPLGGLVMGLAGGALVGRLMDFGIDGKFVKEVEQEIQPGTSALFVLARNADPTAGLAILRQFKGKVIQTNLSGEAEDSLRKALGDTK
jgi:uncharacterized membrane protein